MIHCLNITPQWWCMIIKMAYVWENKACIILNTFLSSSELRRGQGFFSFTATSTDLHLTFCVRGTKERRISLRTSSILHSCGHMCPWKIQERQADRLAVYLTKDSTQSPKCISEITHILPVSEPQPSAGISAQTGFPRSRKGKVDGALGRQSASFPCSWRIRSMATFSASHPPPPPDFLIHMSSCLYDHISKRLDPRVGWRSFWPFLKNALALPPSLSCCPVFGFIFLSLAGLSQMWGAAPLSP